jgi:hypothetical protein
VLACYMAPSVLSATLGGRLTATQAQRVGMTVFLGGMNSAAVAIYNGSLDVFIVATIVAGIGQGIAVSGTTRGLLQGTSVVDRAPIFSAIYLLCYGGATILSLIAGGLSGTISLPYIAFGYDGLAAIATLFTIHGTCGPIGDHPRSSVRSKATRTSPNSADIARPGGRRSGPDRRGG